MNLKQTIMKKQLLLIVMLLSTAASAFAVEEVEIDGLWYEVVAKAKEAKVIQHKNNVKYNGDIVIPETVVYEGVTYSVTSIGDYAFWDCSDLTSVTIPNSVTYIGDYAFQNCSGLTSVAIGGGVKSIRSGAFANCEELTDVTCYAKIIPSTESNVFNDSYIEYATLHVPTGAINAYKATEPWKNFKKIVALTDQELSVDAITNDSNEAVARYTIGGQRANRQTKGLNIVRMSNGTSKKVVAK